MPDTMRLDNVPGSRIVFRNFRGKPTPVTKGGDRNFCLILSDGPDYKSHLIRDRLVARGCNIKKLKNGTEFVNVAVRITPEEKVDYIWEALDIDEIDKAFLEFTFYEYNINGRKGTRIYLKNARFCVKDLFGQYFIDIRWPNTISVTNSTNTNNTEETNMEKIMSVEEIFTQFALLEYAYKNANSTDKKNLEDIMRAVRSAKHYLIPNTEDKPVNTNKPTVTGYELEKTGDFASIKQVMFNDNATIVIWFDDVKTVVKCQKGDTFDKEKGLAMAICKRLYGNESNFNNLIKKYVNDNKNVQTKKKAKEGTFAERKAERMAQVEANKTVKGKSKADKKKALDKARKVKDNSNVVITDAYANHVRVKMAKRGIKSYSELAKLCGVSQTTFSRSFGDSKRKSKVMYRKTFNKINKALGIRWG